MAKTKDKKKNKKDTKAKKAKKATKPKSADKNVNGSAPALDDDGMHSVDLNLYPNEASDLMPVESNELLEKRGWERAFYTVLDEGVIENCIAIVAQCKSDDGNGAWQVEGPKFKPTKEFAGLTEDAEGLARWDGWVYAIGSHYGSKAGPLENRRHWLARFREDDLAVKGKTDLQISMNNFRLHRAVNDALKEKGPGLLPVGPKVQQNFIERTLARKKKDKKARGNKKKWLKNVKPGDFPMNIEGCAFTAQGNFLLALRFPLTAAGKPILVELENIEQVFHDAEYVPQVKRFWVLEDAGNEGEMNGFRALHRNGNDFHAILGSIDAIGKNSTLLEDYPEGGETCCSHVSFKLSPRARSAAVKTKLEREFPDIRNVEGLAADGQGGFFYVIDMDSRVHVKFMLQS